MSTIILVATLATIATAVASMIIARRTPEPTVASMLRRRDPKQSDNR